ncbi:hypothetical protein Micbo1qcDRAFT_176718 [Microdochium bolleyi]|uniref:Uncharacterized protein n=1 Tax=Microdochium bolleyi TaxID=196109 RepID=A0A136IZ53_9PEZI|nr:hypothetical protein Micbo1qcDRAFT_176718 [Microdochium bolleyi]
MSMIVSYLDAEATKSFNDGIQAASRALCSVRQLPARFAKNWDRQPELSGAESSLCHRPLLREYQQVRQAHSPRPHGHLANRIGIVAMMVCHRDSVARHNPWGHGKGNCHCRVMQRPQKVLLHVSIGRAAGNNEGDVGP